MRRAQIAIKRAGIEPAREMIDSILIKLRPVLKAAKAAVPEGVRVGIPQKDLVERVLPGMRERHGYVVRETGDLFPALVRYYMDRTVTKYLDYTKKGRHASNVVYWSK